MSLYILFAIIGFAASGIVYTFLVKREGYPLKLPLFAAVFSCIGLFVGARLFGALAARLYFIYSGEIIPAGFVFYGGFFGYLAVFLIMQKAAFGKKSPMLCDCLAVAVPLFHGLGRIGCFFAGCCYGLILGFPVQLAESIFNFSLFGVLLRCFLKNKHCGNLLPIYMLSYAVARFCLEFFRADAERGAIGFLSLGQACSVAALLIGLVFMIKKD